MVLLKLTGNIVYAENKHAFTTTNTAIKSMSTEMAKAVLMYGGTGCKANSWHDVHNSITLSQLVFISAQQCFFSSGV